ARARIDRIAGAGAGEVRIALRRALTYIITSNYIEAMRARIVKIGNSQGIRIPKIVLEQTRLKDEVELRVQDHEIIITTPQKPRAGWQAAFIEMANQEDDKLLDAPLPSVTQWESG